MEEKTFVDDINRSVYDIKNEENDSYRICLLYTSPSPRDS